MGIRSNRLAILCSATIVTICMVQLWHSALLLRQIDNKNADDNHRGAVIMRGNSDSHVNITYHINTAVDKMSVTGANLEHETAKREAERLQREFWYYIKSELNTLSKRSTDNAINDRITSVLSDGDIYQRMIKHNLFKLMNADKQEEFKTNESLRLGKLVQRRLHFLQNPKDCSRAKKLVCDILHDSCGFGCQLHHVTYCLIQAYATNRTLILVSKQWNYDVAGWEAMFQPLSNTCTDSDGSSKADWSTHPTEDIQVIILPVHPYIIRSPDYMPLAIPDDLADTLLLFHGDPSAWWVGQFVKYATRPQPHLEEYLRNTTKRLSFGNPTVGIHVRRTDKIIEASFHDLEEYMIYVEEWFDAYEMRGPGVRRQVFLASDDNNLLAEARQKYPKYTFISDNKVSQTAGTSSRYTKLSLFGIIQDIHFLSRCDYIVCTFSSGVGRAAYELMQTMHGDASMWFRSLDDMYYFQGQNKHLVYATENHIPKPNIGGNEIEIQINDVIHILGNHWNGFSKGIHLRTGQTGLYPSFKTVEKVSRIKMPTYPDAEIS